jgi:hypothetical protein
MSSPVLGLPVLTKTPGLIAVNNFPAYNQRRGKSIQHFVFATIDKPALLFPLLYLPPYFASANRNVPPIRAKGWKYRFYVQCGAIRSVILCYWFRRQCVA